MFRVGGFLWPCLLFGWNCSPIIAQSCLGRLVNLSLAGMLNRGFGWEVFYYYDGMLILAVSTELCALLASLIVDHLRGAGLVISPKSMLTAGQDV